MIEWGPFHVLVAELQEVIAEEPRSLPRDGRVGILLLLLEEGALKYWPPLHQFVGERDDAKSVVGPIDGPAVHGVESAPDHIMSPNRRNSDISP